MADRAGAILACRRAKAAEARRPRTTQAIDHMGDRLLDAEPPPEVRLDDIGDVGEVAAGGGLHPLYQNK